MDETSFLLKALLKEMKISTCSVLILIPSGKQNEILYKFWSFLKQRHINQVENANHEQLRQQSEYFRSIELFNWGGSQQGHTAPHLLLGHSSVQQVVLQVTDSGRKGGAELVQLLWEPEEFSFLLCQPFCQRCTVALEMLLVKGQLRWEQSKFTTGTLFPVYWELLQCPLNLRAAAK